ncbi:hypothetical protein SGRIM119S_03746 [Streptomyces griseorubiginosus]
MRVTRTTRTGHLAIAHTVSAASPIPRALPAWRAMPPVKTTIRALATARIINTTVSATRRGRIFQTGRTLGHVVHPVRGADERRDVAGGRPDRQHQAHDRHEGAGAGVALKLFDGPGDDVAGRAGGELPEVVEHLVGGRLAGQAQQGHQDQQGREQRQHAVVREGGRAVGQLVVLELAHGPFEDPAPCSSGQPGRSVGCVALHLGPRPGLLGRRSPSVLGLSLDLVVIRLVSWKMQPRHARRVTPSPPPTRRIVFLRMGQVQVVFRASANQPSRQGVSCRSRPSVSPRRGRTGRSGRSPRRPRRVPGRSCGACRPRLP